MRYRYDVIAAQEQPFYMPSRPSVVPEDRALYARVQDLHRRANEALPILEKRYERLTATVSHLADFSGFLAKSEEGMLRKSSENREENPNADPISNIKDAARATIYVLPGKNQNEVFKRIVTALQEEGEFCGVKEKTGPGMPRIILFNSFQGVVGVELKIAYLALKDGPDQWTLPIRHLQRLFEKEGRRFLQTIAEACGEESEQYVNIFPKLRSAIDCCQLLRNALYDQAAYRAGIDSLVLPEESRSTFDTLMKACSNGGAYALRNAIIDLTGGLGHRFGARIVSTVPEAAQDFILRPN